MARGGEPSPALLAAVALAAAALNQLFWLLPLALMLGLPALWWGNAVLGGLALAAFLMLAWLLQPRQADPPHELRPEEAPLLYERVHALADALQAPRVHGIALDGDLNAGALELNRGVSLRPVRRVLILGRPLLAALDARAAEAVIAHELAHFSRHHGRLGHWLYRTRQSWAALSELEQGVAQDSSAWERAAGRFASRFLPWFDRLSMAHMRRCEFEADLLAAQVAGAETLARALVQLERLHSARVRVGELLRRRLMRSQAELPADLHLREVDAWRDAAAGADLGASEAQAEPDGTHPPLAQRLAALGVQPAADAWPVDSAGASWFGQRWPEVAAAQDDVEAARLHWRMAHRMLQHLPDTDESVAASGQSPHALLQRARIELVAGHREAARALLEACRQHKTAERDVATAWLVEHALGDDPEQRRRHAAWLRAVRARREAAVENLATAREQGHVGPAPLDAATHRALASAWREHPAVREAWLFGQALTVQKVDYQAAVLLLRVDPLGTDEDQLAALAHELLRVVSPPALVRLVLTRYTTEGLPPVLAGALAAQPSTRLI